MPRPAEAAVGWHRRSFPRVLLAVVLSCALATLGPAAPAGADEDLGWVNGTRAHNGLSVLAEDSGLDEVARRHTESMIGQGSLFHSSSLAGAIEPIHPDWQRIGENVGVGPSSADIDAAFLKSPEHRVNILGAYNLAGTATAVGPDGRVWITEEFVQVPGGHPPGGPAAGPAPERGSPLPAPSSPAAGAGSAALPSRPAEGGRVAKRRPAATAAAASPDGEGYWVVGHDGGVLSFGDASFAGSLGGRTLNAPVTAVMPAPDVGGDRTARRPETDGRRSRPGYWLVGADGGVFSFGGARFAGSLAGIPLNAPTVAAAASPDGHGYWLVDARGGVFSLGSATFMGSTGGLSLNAPITAITPTPDGRGYWLVGADGGVFAFGDAPFAGSLADRSLRSPVTAAASTPDGRGYWLVDADGGVFSFGDAPFAGSLAGKALNAPITAAAANPNGRGYWLVGADGGVFSLGQATFMGSGQQTG